MFHRIDIPASEAVAWAHTRNNNSPRAPRPRRSYFEDYVTSPLRTFSGDSMRRIAGIIEPYSPFPITSFLGEQIHDAPEQLLSPAIPPPPSYSASVKPMLLWLGKPMISVVRPFLRSNFALDGGGNKVVIETHFLEDLMHKLAWDLKFTSSQPGRMPEGEYIIPPKDCFDWVASCGCGTYVDLSGLAAR